MKYPSTDGPTERTVRACQILKSLDEEYFHPVIAVLMSQEQKSRRKTRVPRATRVDLVRDGRKVRGGKAYVNLSNPDVRIEEGSK